MAKQNGGIMSPRGSITSDARTNTLIVTDTEEKMPRIKEVVKEIDIPNDQVLIESRIVEVERKTALSFGINYNFSGIGGNGTIGLNTFNAGGGDGGGGDDPVTTAIGSTADLAWTLFGGVRLELEIQAAESESLLNNVASPHLVVANNETALIKQGTQVPFNQSTASGAASVAFQEAVLELQVTPQIAPDGNIVMELLVTKNSVIPNTGGGGTSDTPLPPSIQTREVTTKIMTKDGQTVVIGGIYEKNQTEVRDKIPFLGDLPYVGYLFSHTVIANEDKELLIFITPKIIESRIQN
jgi:type IV pilus assembly protein PilQ